MRFLTHLISICLIAQILSGCATRIKYIPLETVKTEYIDRYSRDSIMIRDSIYINRYQRNDTITIYEYRDRILYRDVLRMDSIIRVDSIPYPVRVEIDKIIYKRKWYDTIQLYLLWALVAGLGVFSVFNWIKSKIKLI